MTAAAFAGFPPEAMNFLGALKANNDRDWFAAHRTAYDESVRKPAEAFVAAITPPLEALTRQAIRAKIFRIHRDVRFSKDKSPYNASIHIGFSVQPASGEARPSACSFFFGLEPDRLHLGGGAFEFAGALDVYRGAVADGASGATLAQCVQALTERGYRLNTPDLKRTPAPYPADHPRGELLRRKGLAAWHETANRRLIESPALIGETLRVYQDLAPLNQWIDAALAGA